MSAGGRSRAAALALLAGVVVVIGAALVVPAGLYWSKTGATIKEARTKMLRAEQLQESVTALEGTRTAWSGFVSSTESGFVLAQDDEDAVSQVEARIRSIIAQLNGTTTTLSVEATEGRRAGVRDISFEMRGIIPRKDLGPFLTAMESDPAFIIISRFKATAMSGARLRLDISGSAFRLLEPGS